MHPGVWPANNITSGEGTHISYSRNLSIWSIRIVSIFSTSIRRRKISNIAIKQLINLSKFKEANMQMLPCITMVYQSMYWDFVLCEEVHYNLDNVGLCTSRTRKILEKCWRNTLKWKVVNDTNSPPTGQHNNIWLLLGMHENLCLYVQIQDS